MYVLCSEAFFDSMHFSQCAIFSHHLKEAKCISIFNGHFFNGLNASSVRKLQLKTFSDNSHNSCNQYRKIEHKAFPIYFVAFNLPNSRSVCVFVISRDRLDQN